MTVVFWFLVRQPNMNALTTVNNGRLRDVTRTIGRVRFWVSCWDHAHLRRLASNRNCASHSEHARPLSNSGRHWRAAAGLIEYLASEYCDGSARILHFQQREPVGSESHQLCRESGSKIASGASALSVSPRDDAHGLVGRGCATGWAQTRSRGVELLRPSANVPSPSALHPSTRLASLEELSKPPVTISRHCGRWAGQEGLPPGEASASKLPPTADIWGLAGFDQAMIGPDAPGIDNATAPVQTPNSS